MKRRSDFLGKWFHQKLAVLVLLLVWATAGHSQTLGEALNATNLMWTTSGSNGAPGWTIQGSTTHDGVLAAQSGRLFGGQTSILQTVTNGPGTMTFWWYCPAIDRKLAVFVNNMEIWGMGGSFGWDRQTIYLGSGFQTVKWVYSTLSLGGSERCYVDEVVFTPGTTAPIINTQPLSQSQVPGLNATFSATVIGTPPLLHQWQFNEANIVDATNSTFTITNVQAEHIGSYRVVVTNIAGSVVSSNALLGLGNVTAWGSGYFGQTSVAYGATNVIAISVGGYDGFALQADGGLLAWGYDLRGQLTVPAEATNAVAISAGNFNCLALKPDGTVVAWDGNSFGQTNVPAGLSNVVAISGGGNHNLALKSDGTVIGWGYNQYGQTSIPAHLSNVVAIAATDPQLSVALKSDGTVVAWGFNQGGATNVPSGLTNVVAISACGICLALKDDGTVVAWGAY